MQMQPAPHNDDAGAVYAVGPWPTYTPPLADGEGRELVQSFCGICHSTTYITMQPPLTSAAWEAEVNKMIGTFGAPIPEPSAQAISAYLKEPLHSRDAEGIGGTAWQSAHCRLNGCGSSKLTGNNSRRLQCSLRSLALLD